MQWYERLDEKLRDYLPDMTVEHDVPMSRHTSFRIGGPARRMAFPESREQLVILLGLAEECGVQPFLLGRGTNLLVSDRGLDTLVIKTAERMTGIRRLDDVTLEADAGVLLSPSGGICPAGGAGGAGICPRHPRQSGGRGVHECRGLWRRNAPGSDGGHRPVSRRHPPSDRPRGRLRLSAQPVSGPTGRRGAGCGGAPDPGRSRRHPGPDGRSDGPAQGFPASGVAQRRQHLQAAGGLFRRDPHRPDAASRA